MPAAPTAVTAEETVARLFSLDDDRREIIAATQALQEQRNRLSKEIGQAMGEEGIAARRSLSRPKSPPCARR